MTTQQQLNRELMQELKQLKSEFAKYKRNFEIEKNIKNCLYFFILTNDLVDLLKQFKQENNDDTVDYHMKSLDYLVENIP